MNILNVSISPHIRAKSSTRGIMLDVIIALLPSLAVGVLMFGYRAAVVIALSVISCVATEWIYEKLMKQPNTVGDLSAAVTGFILAANLYAFELKYWWVPVLGGIFAILVVKMLFGGIGQNFMNPALAARCFLLLSFSKIMTTYAVPVTALAEKLGVDAVSSATPLTVAKTGEAVDLLQMLLGTHAGAIGETSAIAVLIGAIYLFARGVIRPHGPISVVLSTVAFSALFTLIHGDIPVTWNYLAVQALGGGLLVGAVFMASDYATTPVTLWGQILFGVCVGLITALIRVFSSSGEGLSFAIIICNLLTPALEKLTSPRAFGKKRQKKGEVAAK